jgi:hypothetical protein
VTGPRDGSGSVRSRALAAVAVAALLVLAGCSAGLGGEDPPPTESLTPVDVPGDRQARASVIAPGLSEAGVYAPRALERRYRNALADRGFRLYRSATVYPRGAVPSQVAPGGATAGLSPPSTVPPESQSPPDATPTPSRTVTDAVVGSATSTSEAPVLDRNGSYNRIVVRSAVEDPAGHYSFSRIETAAPAYRTASSFARIDVWYSQPVVRNRFIDAGGVVRYWGRNEVQPGGPISDPTRAEFVVGDLAAFDLRVVDERTVDGTNRYLLAGTLRPDRIDTPTLVSDPRDGRIEAVVTSRGIVHRYRLSYDAMLEGRPVTVVKTHALVDVGATRVRDPPWLPAANDSVADRSDAVAGTGG